MPNYFLNCIMSHSYGRHVRNGGINTAAASSREQLEWLGAVISYNRSLFAITPRSIIRTSLENAIRSCIAQPSTNILIQTIKIASSVQLLMINLLTILAC